MPGPKIVPIQAIVWIRDQELPMKVNKGSYGISLSIIISEESYHSLYTKAPPLLPTQPSCAGCILIDFTTICIVPSYDGS